MEFVWDPRKDAANSRKHRVGLSEALTVFADPLARIFDDPEHSSEEVREIIVGHSGQRRLLIVCFTERRGTIRIMAPARQPGASGSIMKKMYRSRTRDEIRPEYPFDYGESRPNRFAAHMRGKVVAIMLEPDVARFFETSESVNRLLRSVISAVPQRRTRPRSLKPPRRAS
jgi:uncharacterized protein